MNCSTLIVILGLLTGLDGFAQSVPAMSLVTGIRCDVDIMYHGNKPDFKFSKTVTLDALIHTTEDMHPTVIALSDGFEFGVTRHPAELGLVINLKPNDKFISGMSSTGKLFISDLDRYSGYRLGSINFYVAEADSFKGTNNDVFSIWYSCFSTVDKDGQPLDP